MMKNAIIIFTLSFFVTTIIAQNKGASPIVQSRESRVVSQNTYAVVIGISDYQDKDIPDLKYAHKDAEAFAYFLRSKAGGSLDNNHLKVLLNEQATAAQFAIALDWLMEVAKENDQVILYFSGHGDVEKKTLTQPGYLLCWDAPSRVYLAGGALALPMFQDVISTLSVQNKAKVIVITDACRSGKLSGSSIGGSQITGANLAKQTANEIKILSCQANEFSLEGPQWGDGRGVFSYHLIEGLYGLADRNKDGQVTVGEIDRYLEDHVTGEAAPQSQVPIILGNKADNLAKVDAGVLANLQKFKSGQMAVFASTDSRGFEETELEKLDTATVNKYLAFKEALKKKRFFVDKEKGISADELYSVLMEEANHSPLHATMKRYYAAALQDEAQQAMNTWLKADVQQLQCIGHTFKLKDIPRQLDRAAELLGKDHYMFQTLKARKKLFEGIVLNFNNPYRNDSVGNTSNTLFQESLVLEPNSPLPWHQMCLSYAFKLQKADSALICADKARQLAPNWVLPYADLHVALLFNGKYELALEALNIAETIDSMHPYIVSARARWFAKQPGLENLEKSRKLFEQYRDSGGPMYTCWHVNYGILLKRMNLLKEAEAEFLKALDLATENWSARNELGMLYLNTRRYEEAVSAFLKNIELDESSESTDFNNLGVTYIRLNRYEDAEKALRKAIALDSNSSAPRKHLGMICLRSQRPEEAKQNFLKAVEIEPEYTGALLGVAYIFILEKKNKEAIDYVEQAIVKGSSFEELERDIDLAELRSTPEWNELMKKYFPDRVSK